MDKINELIKQAKLDLSSPDFKVAKQAKVRLEQLIKARHALLLENERMELLARMFRKAG